MIAANALVALLVLTSTAPDEGIAKPSSLDLNAQLAARDRARIDRVTRCIADRAACDRQLPRIDVDDATFARLLKTRARDPKSAALQRSLARAVIEDALAENAAPRSTKRRALTFVDDGATFALDDLDALLLRAKRSDRARILASAKTGLASNVDDERALLDRVAARAGLTRADLIARRVGLDAKSLTKLATSTLAATASYLGPVASDVTLLPDLDAKPDVALVDAPALTNGLVGTDPIFRASLTWNAHRDDSSNFRGKRLRSLVIDTRASALAVIAVLDDVDGDKRDALASRILDDAAAPLPGAAAFLPSSGGGAVVDRFVADLEAPSIAQHVWAREPFAAVEQRFADAPPVDEQGFPEAFVAVLQALQELPP